MKKSLIFFVISLFTMTSSSQEINIARIDSFINRIERCNQGMGAIAISRAGHKVYNRRFGTSIFPEKLRKEGQEPLTEQQKYRVGSITKLFTATMIHRLFSEGRLTPDTTLDRFFPEIPNASGITLSRMLNHTSGLGNYIVRGDSMWTVEPVTEPEIMNEIKSQGIRFEPGKGMSYSNSGYYLLARILEKVYGKRYPQIIEEQILLPSGMAHTLSGIAYDTTIAPSFHLNRNSEWEETKDFYFPNITGVGDLASTPEDLNLFLNALFTGKLLPMDRVQSMMPEGEQMYGCGIMRAPYLDKVLYGHGGATLGTRSIAFYDPQSETAVSVSVNGSSVPFEEILAGIMNGVYDVPNQLKD